VLVVVLVVVEVVVVVVVVVVVGFVVVVVVVSSTTLEVVVSSGTGQTPGGETQLARSPLAPSNAVSVKILILCRFILSSSL